MNKKILLSGIIIFVLLGILTAVLQNLQRPPALIVVGSTPQENAFANPFLPVTIRFNRPPKTNEYSIKIDPETAVTYAASGSAIRITPNNAFQENTNYKITVTTKQEFILLFTTEQAASNVPGWNDAFNKAQQNYQKIYGAGDAALINIQHSSPVKQPGFTIDYSYDNNVYTVTLSPPYDQNKGAFINWMKSLGVTDLSGLPLQYVNQ